MQLYRLPEAEGIDDLTLAEAEAPEPQRGQVKLRMRAWSLNYRDPNCLFHRMKSMTFAYTRDR